ncbi:adhesion G-protein coupled receptor G2-like isoform X3 [Denticeps clupeoides]|uniref:Adhesion G protein-coupled receptor G2a n=1 Tax=Denticeps clupeoides TaxID=299321 RepID=A0AAY4A972_9TELE|nr:adhesion G-protein coupled receptor G2 isoform X3 [Denticeps clupeoides]
MEYHQAASLVSRRMIRLDVPGGASGFWFHAPCLLWLWVLGSPATAYFMQDSKAVLNGCGDFWTLQDHWSIPVLFQMTVCVDVNVVAEGEWTAFTYNSPHTPRHDLALQGDPEFLYVWLLGVKHRFPVRLSPQRWHQICLQRDSRHDRFRLEVGGDPGTYERMVVAHAIPPSGQLLLGCRPQDATPGSSQGRVELYLFRMWADVQDHHSCEDGTVVGWDSRLWGITVPRARAHDEALHCAQTTGGRVAMAVPEVASSATPPFQTGPTPKEPPATPIEATAATLTTPFTPTGPSSSKQITGRTRVKRAKEDNDHHSTYAVFLNITNPNTTITDIQNMICNMSSYCDVQNACTSNTSQAWNNFQAAYVECDGNNQCLHSCMVVLKLNAQVDMGVVSQVMTSLLLNIGHISNTAKMVCGNSCQTGAGFCWTFSDLRFYQICGPQGSCCSKCNEDMAFQCVELHFILTTPLITCNLTQNKCNEDMAFQCEELHFILTTPLITCNLTQNTSSTSAISTSSTDNQITEPPFTTQQSTKQTETEIIERRNTVPEMSYGSSLTVNQTASPGPSESSSAVTPNISTTTVLVNNLLGKTSSSSTLNSHVVEDVVNILEKLVTSELSLNVAKDVLSVVNNLLSASADAVASSANKLIKVVDDLAERLVVQDQSATISTDSLLLSVSKSEGANFSGGSFVISRDPGQQAFNASIRDLGQMSSTNQNWLEPSDQAMIILPASLTSGLSTELQWISRVQVTFFDKPTFFQDNSTKSLSLNSPILGTSVTNVSISGLKDNVNIILRNTKPRGQNNVFCMFWDFSKNNGSGGWNQTGCSLSNNSSDNISICTCNHLTSFAVLLDLNTPENIILTYITYVGCGISAIFLSVTILSYVAFEKIRRDIPSKILIQLCLSLFLLNIVFLMDAWLALYHETPGLCITTAAFLHYFLLASFSWMGLEALHMYLAIIKVFNSYVSRYMLKFSLMGWGIPLVVVIITLTVNKDSYGLVASNGSKDDFCWFKNEVAFYTSVVAYFCIIFLLNLAIFLIVLVQLQRIKRQNPHNNKQRSGMQNLRSVAGLSFLLGLTWGFAFFPGRQVSLAFTYLFTIFNSLQGFFVFVFHCALKENVRRQWRTYLCCGRLRLAENSAWCKTAAHGVKSVTSWTTAPSLHSSISTLTLDQSRHSLGSVYTPELGSTVDEGSLSVSLSDPSGDVVLNDISSRCRSANPQSS